MMRRVKFPKSEHVYMYIYNKSILQLIFNKLSPKGISIYDLVTKPYRVEN